MAVVDIRMPPSFTDEGLRMAIDLRRRFEGLAILMFSQYIETRYAEELLGAAPRASATSSRIVWPM